MTFGFSFPEDGQTTDADEFIGYLVRQYTRLIAPHSDHSNRIALLQKGRVLDGAVSPTADP